MENSYFGQICWGKYTVVFILEQELQGKLLARYILFHLLQFQVLSNNV